MDTGRAERLPERVNCTARWLRKKLKRQLNRDLRALKIIKRYTPEGYKALREGWIRIGSLQYYRRIEDASRADAGEGPRGVIFYGDKSGNRTITAEEMNRASIQAGSIFRIVKPEFKVVLENNTSLVIDTDMNLLVFCTTIVKGNNHKDEHLSRKFGEHTVAVTNVTLFEKLITNALLLKFVVNKEIALKSEVHSISYCRQKVMYQQKGYIPAEEVKVNGTQEPVLNSKDVFMKDVRFAEENEMRFVWFPQNDQLKMACSLPFGFKYLDLHVPKIWKAIRLLPS